MKKTSTASTLARIVLLLIVTILTQTSCRRQPAGRATDDITYFQSAGRGDRAMMPLDSTPAFRIGPGTELNIAVATMNQEMDGLLNPKPGSVPAGLPNNPDTRQPAGYLVDEKGFINFPIVGRVNLLNRTTQEAADIMTSVLSRQVNKPYVTVRVVNFQVTILGEVGRPIVLNVNRERMTLPEAIGLAGDLTIFGKRENVLVVREQGAQREFGRVNLNDRSLFRSPYYYLQPNDMIYVEPKRSKKVQAGRVFPYLPTVFSGASLLLTLLLVILQQR